MCDYGCKKGIFEYYTMLTCICTCVYGCKKVTCTCVTVDTKRGSLNTMLTCACDYGCKKGIFEYYAYIYMWL